MIFGFQEEKLLISKNGYSKMCYSKKCVIRKNVLFKTFDNKNVLFKTFRALVNFLFRYQS